MDYLKRDNYIDAKLVGPVFLFSYQAIKSNNNTTSFHLIQIRKPIVHTSQTYQC